MNIIYVNELIDLPEGALVVGGDGRSWLRTDSRFYPWRCSDGSGYGHSQGNLIDSCDRFLRYEGPLKVVWRP